MTTRIELSSTPFDIGSQRLLIANLTSSQTPILESYPYEAQTVRDVVPQSRDRPSSGDMSIPSSGVTTLMSTINDRSKTVVTTDGNDQQDGASGSSSTLPVMNGDDITYEYLSWKSEVPFKPLPPNGFAKELPPRPDLSVYENPFDWPIAKKRLATCVVCTTNITAAYAAGSYAFPASVLTAKWHISLIVYNLGILMFTVGFGVAPMILAPFSEINGRRPVFVTTGILFVLMQLACSLTNTFGGMLVSRLFLGCAGSTFSTMVGGILADIWISSERNTPMVLFAGSTIFGTGLGPLVSGFVAQNLDWRWVFYLQVMTSGVLVTLVVVYFKETRGSILLSRKAKALNRWYEELEAVGCYDIGCDSGNDKPVNGDSEKCQVSDMSQDKTYHRLRYRAKGDEERTTLLRMITLSLYRPLHMLITEPVVFWFSAWISFAWGVLYLEFAALPLIYRTIYAFDLQQSGAVFAACSVAGILSTFLSIYQEKLARRSPWFRQKLDGSPEGRLYFTGVQSALMPIGLFWFGWTCTAAIHWIVPTIAVTFISMGIFSIYLAVFNYSADVYQSYASSALAAAGICRNLLAGSFPLITDQMFTGLGFGQASSLLGAIGIALTAVPWVLIFFGPKIRARSKIASQFIDQ